jgi:hypothetical protein
MLFLPGAIPAGKAFAKKQVRRCSSMNQQTAFTQMGIAGK